MRPQLIAELSDLFLVESLAADKSGNEDEADRLWVIAEKLSAKAKKKLCFLQEEGAP